MLDLYLAKLTYHPGTLFARVFSAIGELPALLPFLLLLATLIGSKIGVKELKDRKKELLRYAVCAMFAVALSALTVTVLKHVTCRERYFISMGKNYSPWYLKGAGGDSFPSGHASMSFFIMLVPDFIKTFYGGKRPIITVACAGFFISVCVSRMLEGAHYFSDLVAGATISWIFIIMARKIAVRIGLIKSQNLVLDEAPKH